MVSEPDSGDVPVRRLILEGGGHEVVPTRTLGPKQGGFGGGSYIYWRKERVPVRTLGHEGDGL